MSAYFQTPDELINPISLTDTGNHTTMSNIYDEGRWLYFLCGVLFMTSIFFAYSQISSIRKPVVVNEARVAQDSSSTTQRRKKRKGAGRLSASRTCDVPEVSTTEKAVELDFIKKVTDESTSQSTTISPE